MVKIERHTLVFGMFEKTERGGKSSLNIYNLKKIEENRPTEGKSFWTSSST